MALNGLQDRRNFIPWSGSTSLWRNDSWEHNRENDLVVNVCKTKKLTNMRAAGSDDAIRLSTPRKFYFWASFRLYSRRWACRSDT